MLNLLPSNEAAVYISCIYWRHIYHNELFISLNIVWKSNQTPDWGPLWSEPTLSLMASCVLNELSRTKLPPERGKPGPSVRGVCIMCLPRGGCPLSMFVCAYVYASGSLHTWVTMFVCLCFFKHVCRLFCVVTVRVPSSLFMNLVCVCFLISYCVLYIYSAHLWDGLLSGNERDFIHESPMQISQW